MFSCNGEFDAVTGLMQDIVNGYQAKLASQGQTTKTRHPGGRGGGKRGGKVHTLPLEGLGFGPEAVWSSCVPALCEPGRADSHRATGSSKRRAACSGHRAVSCFVHAQTCTCPASPYPEVCLCLFDMLKRSSVYVA